MYVFVCMQISSELILTMCIHCHSHCCYVSDRFYIRLELVCGSGSRVCVPAEPGDRNVSIHLAVIPGALMLALRRIVVEHKYHDYHRRDT